MFIDSHAHIDGPEFDADRDEVIQRARDAGVSVILNVGTGDPNSGALERSVDLTSRSGNVYGAVGTHPHDARLYDNSAEDKIRKLINDHSRVIAWGEIGLDFHYDNSPREVQLDVFRRQLRSARGLKVPVIVHTREAEVETIEALRTEWFGPGLAGIMHCFSGSQWLAEQAIELGMLISFSGILTFKKADDLRAIARRVPLDQLLIETDCPYLTPVPYRGKRNEPAYVVEVARCLAELREISLDEIANITTANFTRLFGLPTPLS
ncbi:MAG: TatD family hydrolase [Blastocatellia bacterium]|nr:TatD family hydrolase [Blastocatellia bacterium]